MLSTSEVLKRTKINSSRTLDHYRKLGLVPDPTIALHESGRGKTGYWRDDAPDRIKTVRELLSLGKALDATEELVRKTILQWKAYQANRLSTDAGGGPTPSAASRRHYKFAEASMQMDAEQALIDFILAVEVNLREMGGKFADPTALANGWHAYVTRKHACEVVRLLEMGVNPVLAFDGDLVRVVADFVAADRVAEMKTTSTALLVMPIGDDLRAILAKVTPKATVRPKVQGKVIEGSAELGFRRKGDWDFEIALKP